MPIVASRRELRRVAGPRRRRGATLIMVALFSVAIVGMAAFAIDLSRLYVGTNELQTRADATALNAALLLQRNPATAQLSHPPPSRRTTK